MSGWGSGAVEGFGSGTVAASNVQGTGEDEDGGTGKKKRGRPRGSKNKTSGQGSIVSNGALTGKIGIPQGRVPQLNVQKPCSKTLHPSPHVSSCSPGKDSAACPETS
jgi:hypothetical protein